MLNGVRCPALHTAGRDSPCGGCWGDRKSQGWSLPSQSNGGVRRHDNLRDFPGWERPSPDRGGNSGFLLMLSLPRGLPPSPSRGAEWGTVPPTCQGPPAQLCTWSARTHPHIPREPAHLLSLCPGWGWGWGLGPLPQLAAHSPAPSGPAASLPEWPVPPAALFRRPRWRRCLARWTLGGKGPQHRTRAPYPGPLRPSCSVSLRSGPGTLPGPASAQWTSGSQTSKMKCPDVQRLCVVIYEGAVLLPPRGPHRGRGSARQRPFAPHNLVRAHLPTRGRAVRPLTPRGACASPVPPARAG